MVKVWSGMYEVGDEEEVQGLKRVAGLENRVQVGREGERTMQEGSKDLVFKAFRLAPRPGTLSACLCPLYARPMLVPSSTRMVAI